MATIFEIPLKAQEDVVALRQIVRTHAVKLGLSLIDQTKFVTAASELGRNTVIHGGGGAANLEILEQQGPRRGIRLTFEDHGAGIVDIERALQDGYTTGSGLGLGLGGAKRLADEFSIQSTPGSGTRIVITQWSRK